jgi:hypothetical protein
MSGTQTPKSYSTVDSKVPLWVGTPSPILLQAVGSQPDLRVTPSLQREMLLPIKLLSLQMEKSGFLQGAAALSQLVWIQETGPAIISFAASQRFNYQQGGNQVLELQVDGVPLSFKLGGVSSTQS